MWQDLSTFIRWIAWKNMLDCELSWFSLPQTKILYWSLPDMLYYACRNFCLRRDFLTDPDTLKTRLVVMGLTMFLLSPFLVIFMLVYLFRHAEQFYNHPTTVSSQRCSNLSRWMFREFNEASFSPLSDFRSHVFMLSFQSYTLPLHY